ncbi:MAG: TerD family protein [Magnetococcales bacterium]|nr:TerD family protein [Magnetococcales bacterium]
MAVQLQKGEKISLAKESGGRLSRVVMGLGWDAGPPPKPGLLSFLGGGGGEIDLDASCLLFDAVGRIVDAVWFEQLKSKDGSIRHSGDNVSGQGEGDDERIEIDLDRVPAGVKVLVFTINSFSGESFEKVRNSYCRLVDGSNDQEVARYQLESIPGNHTAMIIARLYRHEEGWKMHAIGELTRGKTFHDMMPVIKNYL